MIESKVEYMKTRVPELIKEGNDIGVSAAMASVEWETNQVKAEEFEVSEEYSIEFSGEITETGFMGITQEDMTIADKTFAEIFALLGCVPGKRYEIEVCVEEA